MPNHILMTTRIILKTKSDFPYTYMLYTHLMVAALRRWGVLRFNRIVLLIIP